jgi:hypothetical protein
VLGYARANAPLIHDARVAFLHNWAQKPYTLLPRLVEAFLKFEKDNFFVHKERAQTQVTLI